MSIRIQRNENANAITFVGSSQPAYWNNCLEGEVNETDNTRVNVVNTVRTTDSDNKVFEFFAVPFTEFRTALGTAFSTAQECADYITAQANATAIGIIEFGATDVVDFQRDATNTTILASTGHSYPVNSIKAVAQADGTITIKENVDDGADLMRFVRRTNVTFGGQTQAQQLTPVVNALNGLFTVTPVGTGADDRFISNTYTNHTTTVSTFGDVTITANEATKGTNTGSDFNDGFFTTSNSVSENGEFFQFDNSGNDPLKKMMIGLMLTSEVSVAALEDNTLTGEDMDLAVRLKPNATYEHSPYGAVIENGMFSNPQRSDEYRAGIDDDGRLFISHYDEQASEWQVIVRSALVTANEEYSLVIFLKQENAACSYVITGKEIYSGPVMTYNYIESPDGSFYYPLFATEAEANQEDINNGGSGTNMSHVFADETPAQQMWYMPATGGTHAGGSAPSNTADITYNVIPTGADVNYVPAAFTITDLTVDENTAVNYQVAPAGADYTTTVSGLPAQLSLSGDYIVGTAAEVAGTNDVTPNVTSTVTVTRTNVFGSTTSDFDIIVTNLDAPTTAITGFTHVTGSAAMVDSDTLAHGSAVEINDATNDGNRTIVSAAWLNTHVWAALDAAALTGGTPYVFMGYPNASATWGFINQTDFDSGLIFELGPNGERYVGYIFNGTTGSPANFTTATFAYDAVFYNDTTVSGKIRSQWSAPADSATAVMPTTPTAINVTRAVGDHKIAIAFFCSSPGTDTMDISLSGISETANPTTSPIVTDWDKAVDFSGTSEHLLKASLFNATSPLAMQRVAVTVAPPSTVGETADAAYASPWATAVVFKHDGNNSNQYIWNSAGAGNGDNIYLRMDSAGTVWFGWGRPLALNECEVTNLGTTTNTNHWHGIYVGYNGTRYNASNATAANLADVFDIRAMGTNDAPSAWTTIGQQSTAANWTAGSTGGHMGREFTGTFAIGGQGSSNNFHGKVASMVITGLRRGVAMPTEAEIRLMIKDPKKWETDYRVGQLVRNSNGSLNDTYDPADRAFGYGGTQIWLMGDGTNDSFSNGIRNQVLPTETTHTRLIFNNMVSNDIETVSITGLS